MKARFSLGFVVLAAVMAISSSGISAQREGNNKYASPKRARVSSPEEAMRAAPLDKAAMIDKTMKPNPMTDYGVVIVSGSDVGGIGGFVLKKATPPPATGSAATAFWWNNKRYIFGADLVGYGSTPKHWVYEVKNVKIEGTKMYFGFPKMARGQFTVWASNGKDDPDDASSFTPFGTGERGERP